MIKAQIIADSVCVDTEKRITTFLLTYPRFIHSELMTHRQLSRNAASSRAIPIQKMIKSVWNEPALPVYWGGHQKGMQAGRPLTGWKLWSVQKFWRLASLIMCLFAWCLWKLGLHKQVANRILEPWMHMTTLVTATEWANFFMLRAHPDAQPEFQALAYAMLEEYVKSEPRQLLVGEWHIPYAGDDESFSLLSESDQLKVATARCARTSYVEFDGTSSHEKDIALHDRLSTSGHWSPFEHCAMAMTGRFSSGNLIGWMPYRKRFSGNCHHTFNPKEILERKPK